MSIKAAGLCTNPRQFLPPHCCCDLFYLGEHILVDFGWCVCVCVIETDLSLLNYVARDDPEFPSPPSTKNIGGVPRSNLCGA